MPKLIIASNRSPIDYQKGKEATPAVGGLVQAMIGCLKEDDLWVAVSAGSDDPNRVDERGIIRVQRDETAQQGWGQDGAGSGFRMKKMFIDPERFEKYYSSFANGFLWPLFHCNRAAHYEQSKTYPRPLFDGNDFFNYSLVNRILARGALEEASEDSRIWIQDYHLLQMAARLRERKPSLRIGQFIHIPMFNADVLESYLEQNGEAREGIRYLISGMLANNLLGFHIPQYVENFGKAVRYFFHPAAKIEEQEHGLTIFFSQHTCKVESFPIGTDIKAITGQLDQQLHVPYGDSSLEAIIQEDHEKARLVFAGLERCDYTKGLLERLQIMDCLLERMRAGVRYIGVIDASSRQKLGAYKNLLDIVQKEEMRLNEKWEQELGYRPIIMLYEGVKPPQNYLLLRQADCVLMPLYEDGMNLVLYEAVLSKTGLPHGQRGFLAVGHCGAEKVLSSYGDQHGLVRLYDILDADNCAARILQCIRAKYTISDALIRKVSTLDVNTWRDTYLERLEEVGR